jgi:hypothetical protein
MLGEFGMISPPAMQDALKRSFVTALLLTGSAGLAETAVMEGIAWMDPSRMSDESLFQATVAASMLADTREEEVEEREQASRMLPAALARVLRLSNEPRRCFVLRVLAGLPREVCSRLLRIDTYRIDALACAAARILAGFNVSAEMGAGNV